jgi:hypothetical protein
VPGLLRLETTKTSLAFIAVDTFALIGGSSWEPSGVSKAAPKTRFRVFDDWSKVREGSSGARPRRAKVALPVR